MFKVLKAFWNWLNKPLPYDATNPDDPYNTGW